MTNTQGALSPFAKRMRSMDEADGLGYVAKRRKCDKDLFGCDEISLGK